MQQNVTNAISTLNELQQKKEIESFDFKELGQTGTSHEPLFKIRCIVVCDGDTYKAEAEASNKKAAKHFAAADVLKQLGIDFDEDEISTPEYSSSETSVSCINRYAQQHGYDMPVYSDGNRQGPDHCPTFEVKLEFMGYQTKGTGPSKKAAKEDAATQMIEILNQDSAE